MTQSSNTTERFVSKATEETLAQLHSKLADAMMKKLEEGDFKAADLSVMAKFLSDNGITVGEDDPKQQGLKKKVEEKMGGKGANVLQFPFDPTGTT